MKYRLPGRDAAGGSPFWDQYRDFRMYGHKRRAPRVIDSADDESGIRRMINEMEVPKAIDATGPMVPPWQIIPGYPMTSLAWRMGYGEDYSLAFFDFYISLSEEERRSYSRKYPEPDGWQGYYAIIIERVSQLD